MNAKAIRRLLLCFGTLALMSVGAASAQAANRNSSWGWAKPLNDKPGSLLYTSNVAFKQSTKVRSSNTYRRSYNVTPRYRAQPRFFRRLR